MLLINLLITECFPRIIHYLPSDRDDDSMAVGYVLVNVSPGMEITAYNSIKSMENVDDITAVSIEDEIKSCLANYEPRVELINVNVDANFDQNQFDVVITYRIIGVDIPASQLEFALLPSR